MRKIFGTALAVVLLCMAVIAQESKAEHYSIFDGAGNPVAFEEMARRFESADVVFLGELHDDAVGHAFQLEVFRSVLEKFGRQRPVALSLEMFESDVQHILDEYLTGQITEDHFLASSRPWKNYATDYKPLVELAKEAGVPVIAANAPRRYVNMVSRNGRKSLRDLSKKAKRSLPPLPYGRSSEAYADKFRNLMQAMPAAAGNSGRLENILESQTLWDATMAYWISRHLKKNKNAFVVHLNGGFHTESRLGTPEHLARYRKKARYIVVTIRYEKDFRKFDPARHTNLGDFVVLTDASQPRSRR